VHNKDVEKIVSFGLILKLGMVDAPTQMQGLKPIIGVQYCLPSACQFTLEEMHGR